MGYTNPKVTVLMPVYNGERYVQEAVSSVLNQSFSDFELLVIDDGSSDGTWAILSSIDDPRVRLVRNEGNMGLPATLNNGILLSKGELIARMDDDDVSFPNRLELQVDFMEAHPQVAACGCGVEVFYIKGEANKHYFPTSYPTIKMESLFNNPISHPGVIFRKNIIDGHSCRYDELALWVEDYDLFSRIIQRHTVVNLPYFLLKYRVFGDSVTSRAESPEQVSYRKGAITKIQRANLFQIGFRPTQYQMDLHYLLSLTTRMRTIDFAQYGVKDIKSYLYTIRQHSVRSGYADRASASRITGKIYLKVILYNWKRIGFWKFCSALGNKLLWDGVWDTLALRLDYLLRIKRG